MLKTKEKMIVKITWKSEDGFYFMGEAQGHNWDVVSTTDKAVGQIDVGTYAWCERKSNEDRGIYLEEIAFEIFSNEEDWKKQEANFIN